MPVTARLSKRFYDRFGEEIANELVDWFNQVDATYRSDLKEINELNFARFDAKVEQRFAQFEVRFAQVEVRFAQFEARFAQFEARMERRFGDLTRWLVAAWAALLIPIIGLWFK